MRPDQTETLRTGYCLGSPFDSELRENVLDMRLYRLRRNAEVSCDLLVGLAVADQLENAALARAQRRRNRRCRGCRGFGNVQLAPCA